MGITGDATRRSWYLHLLGNWSGGDVNNGSVFDYPATGGQPGYQTASDTLYGIEHHNVHDNESITGRMIDDQTPSEPYNEETTGFTHDDAWNLIDDNEHTYRYNAWNQLVAGFESVLVAWEAPPIPARTAAGLVDAPSDPGGALAGLNRHR
ncbi:MAG: hypothetical protein JSU86_02910 [Phycisphaerales bacterium]|nr:MAG: hypothetical protein JSU86_02910 [Phycisphaerales bacterium]